MNHARFVPLRGLRACSVRLRRKGQTLVEYALILAIISIVAIGVLINVGQGVKAVYTMIDSQISASQSH